MHKLIRRLDHSLVHLLLPLGLIFVILTFLVPQSKQIQAGLAMTFIYLYIGFSLLHHKADKSLTLEIALEYLLIATLTLVLLLGLLI